MVDITIVRVISISLVVLFYLAILLTVDYYKKTNWFWTKIYSNIIAVFALLVLITELARIVCEQILVRG